MWVFWTLRAQAPTGPKSEAMSGGLALVLGLQLPRSVRLPPAACRMEPFKRIIPSSSSADSRVLLFILWFLLPIRMITNSCLTPCMRCIILNAWTCEFQMTLGPLWRDLRCCAIPTKSKIYNQTLVEARCFDKGPCSHGGLSGGTWAAPPC